MMNSMKWFVVAALLIVAGPMVSCADDEKCPGGETQVTLTGSCKTFFDKICACKPLPTGVSQADCDQEATGIICEKPEDVLSEQECKDILTFVETQKVDVCKEDLSAK